jgi:hypothetical protein
MLELLGQERRHRAVAEMFRHAPAGEALDAAKGRIS